MPETFADLFLSYNHKDEVWVKDLASKIESESFGNRKLRVFLDDWDIAPGKNMVKEMERGLETSRHIAVVLSENSIDAEWPDMERSIAISYDPSGRKGTVIPIWLGGCDIPPSLKIKNVLYCRNEAEYKASYRKLIAYLKNEALPRGKPATVPPQNTFYSEQFPLSYEDEVDEQLASNIFPVDIPEIVWSGSTHHTDDEVFDLLRKNYPVIPTYIIKQKRVFCFWDPHEPTCPFQTILSSNVIESESTDDWLNDEDKSRWLVMLLNRSLSSYCRSMKLHRDGKHKRYYFEPDYGKNRKISWNTGKRTASRTVTTWQDKTGYHFWSHLTLTAKFMVVGGELFLHVDPGWMFTSDGKTPLPPDKSGPLSTRWTTNERNPSAFLHVRFWMNYLSKGAESIVLPLGGGTCRIDTVPAVVELNKGLFGDWNPVDKMFEIADKEIQAADELRDILMEEEQ